jgi:hypothetical protein
MTKSQEIKLLDQTIKKFGKDSYIGPWLVKIKDSLIWAIENDLDPENIQFVTGRSHPVAPSWTIRNLRNKS